MTEDGFVPYLHRVGYLLNKVPDTHMRCIHQKAEKQDTSMTNVAAAILAARYEIPFVTSTRNQVQPLGAVDNISLRLPAEVFAAIRAEADERAVTIRTVILDALSEAFRLKAPAPTSVNPARRPGRPPKERTV